MKNERGFTLPELLFAVWGVVCLCMAGILVYVAFHFISKFW